MPLGESPDAQLSMRHRPRCSKATLEKGYETQMIAVWNPSDYILITPSELEQYEVDRPGIDLSILASQDYRRMEAEVIRIGNVERKKHDLHDLLRNEVLSQSALLHTLDMAENHFISHIGTDGSDLRRRVQRLSRDPWIILGENLAIGHETPVDVIAGWMASPGHRANLLLHNFCEIGVAYIESEIYTDGRYWRGGYWAQNFGTIARPIF
jgi:uncharacterized protein YkwD